MIGAFVLGGPLDFVDEALAAALGLVFFVAVVVGYPVAFETRDPRPQSWARWPWGCGWCARTAARCGSGTRSSAA